MKIPAILSLLFLLILWSCQPAGKDKQEGTVDINPHSIYDNPSADGFNAEGSDPRAVAIADSVMAAMGGRQAWDTARYAKWNFFGNRILLWDKYTGDVRIEIPADSTVYLTNIHTLEGKAMEGGEVVENPDTLEQRMQRAKSIWINDSYWLFMPFKLKDSGVTLKYLGQDTTQTGESAHVLQLTFEEVGDTPQNKYHVYVDTDDYLVRQWAYFRNASDEEPGFMTPWDGYAEYSGLLLSGGRGERGITDIEVMEKVPGQAFQSLEPMYME